MGDNDKELSEEELLRFLAELDLDSEESKSDAETIAQLDALDAPDRVERVISDEIASRSRGLTSELPASATPTPAIREMPLKEATDPREVVSSGTVSPISVRHLFRITKRKAGKYRPNCFGSQYLHDPESADCRPCIYSEDCKKTIAEEVPLIKAQGTAHSAPFKPSTNPAQLKSQAAVFRARHLRAFRKSLEKRLEKDRIDHRDKREKTSAEIRIKREAKKRLTILHSATAKPGKNKRIEQLRGREIMIMSVWEAMQHARLIHGPGVTDAQVAETFEGLGSGHFTRHQARSYRLLFKRLAGTLTMPSPKTTG